MAYVSEHMVLPSRRSNAHIVLAAAALAVAASPVASAKTQQGATDPVRLTRTTGSNVRLAGGGKTRVVVLPGLDGCLGELYDPTTDSRYRADPTIRVLDETSVLGRVYVLVQTTANSGCNVQGYCGAGSESSLVWLEVDAKTLRITQSRTQPLVSCFDEWTLTDPVVEGYDEQQLNMRDGRLDITAERSDFEHKETTTVRVTYDRRKPRAGFATATTRRPL